MFMAVWIVLLDEPAEHKHAGKLGGKSNMTTRQYEQQIVHRYMPSLAEFR